VFDPRQEQRIFPLTSMSRPALRPTQPPVQWVLGVLFPGVKRGRDVTLTTHPLLVPWSKMSRSYTSSTPQAPPWRVAGLLCILLYLATIYTISIYLFPFFGRHILVSLLRNIPELLNFHFEHWRAPYEFTEKKDTN
jgi:hypothetical protein